VCVYKSKSFVANEENYSTKMKFISILQYIIEELISQLSELP